MCFLKLKRFQAIENKCWQVLFYMLLGRLGWERDAFPNPSIWALPKARLEVIQLLGALGWGDESRR